MAFPTIADYLKYANLQMAAEAFIRAESTGVLATSTDEVIAALVRGNHHASYFTPTQAADFVAQWEVVAQCKNTSTGFSGTLFRNRTTGELVLSLRSTEAYDDAIRDSSSTNTLEIHSTGWAWGQISDMEAWYTDLKEAGLIPEGAPFDVTGYSLGGHLATTFNLLHQSELHGGQVITYNGAGVGEVKTGYALAETIAYFDTLRQTDAEGAANRLNALDLTQIESQQFYAILLQNLADKTWTEQQALTALQAVKTSIATIRLELVAQELKPLETVLTDIIALQNEAERIKSFTSGATPNQADTPINIVDADDIEAQTLAYRLAVYLAGQRTEGTNLVADLSQTTQKQYGGDLGNQYDLVGKETTGLAVWSAVANSQLHYGKDDGIFIEDQPFTRGSFTIELLKGMTAGQINLLQDRYKLNSFADTHSLTLIIDSLNIQNTLLNLLPESQRSNPETRNALRQILKNAANRKADGQLGSQGQAEGSPLENILNALGILMLGPDQWKTLRGDPSGGTWYYDKDHSHADHDGEWVTYNGRNSFYEALDKLVSSDAYGQLQGKLTLTPLDASDVASIRDNARTDFAAFAALYTLSSFRLGGAALEAAVGGAWGKLYIDWQEDQQLDEAARAAGQAQYSDDWYADRGDFLKYWLEGAANNQSIIQDGNLENTTTQRIYKQLDSRQKIVVQNSVGGNVEPLDSKDSQHYLFGGNKLDLLTGNQLADHLYGMGGLDVLAGNKGDDRLEGGAGLDFYRFRTGDGQDTVLDTDGPALLQRNDELFTLAYKTGDDSWTGGTGANTYTAIRSGDDLTLTFSDSDGSRENDSITLKNFDFAKAETAEGSYGLRLIGDLPARLEGGRTFGGDLEDWDSNPGEEGIQPVRDDLGNTVRADGEGGRPLIGKADRNDAFNGSEGDDLFPFHDQGGNDTVNGNAGNDCLELGAGRDTAHAGGGNDWIEGGAGGDMLFGNEGDDVLLAETSDDGLTLEVAIRNGEAGEGAGEANLLAGGGGNDTLIGGTGGDFLAGGLGKDILVGGAGDDNLFGDTEPHSASRNWRIERRVEIENDVTFYRTRLYNGDWQYDDGIDDADLLIGGAGDDWMFGGAGGDLLLGGVGNDVLLGKSDSDVLQGGDGNDMLGGDAAFLADSECGDDILDGGAGDDGLWGYAGNDVLIGGKGNDTLFGDAGKDVYIYNKGDGTDVIVDTPVDADDPEASVLILGPGITKADVKFRLGSLHVDVGHGEGVHFEGFDSDDPYATPVVGEIRFDDGNVMNYQDILAQGFDIDGTADDDALVGSAVTDRMDGGEGNDSLWGKGGNDTLMGGVGGDYLMGDDVASQLAGEFHGDDVLDGVAGNDTLFGMGGNDTLIGGTDRDYLEGGDGADTYVFNLGDGADRLVEASGSNVIRFGEGISPENLSVLSGTYWNDFGYVSGVRIGYGQGDAVLIQDGLLGRIDRLEFADGGSLAWAEVMARAPTLNVTGSSADDHIIGTPSGDKISGASGDDRLEGMSGDDSLIGGYGSDTLMGGAGSDWLEGGEGDDVYLFNSGDGADAIIDAGGSDTVVFGEGFAPSDLTVHAARYVDGQQILEIGFGSADRLSITNGHIGGVEHFRFADGTEMSLAEVMQRVIGYVGGGTASHDVMEGSSGDDALRGFGGNDILRGDAGNDLLEGGDGYDLLEGGDGDDDLFGGTGNDTLIGGAGRDTYYLHLGMGADRVIEAGGESSLIRVDPALCASDLVAIRTGDDLRIDVAGTSDSLILASYFAEHGYWVVDVGQGERPLDEFLATTTTAPASGEMSYQQAMAQFLRALELARQADLSAQGYALEADGVWHKRISSRSWATHEINTGLVFETMQSDDAWISVNGIQESLIGRNTSSERQTIFRIQSGQEGAEMPQQKTEPYFIPAGGDFGIRWMSRPPLMSYDSTGKFLGFWVYPEGFTGSQSTPPVSGTFGDMYVSTTTSRWEFRSTFVEGGGADSVIDTGGGTAVDGGAGNDAINGDGYRNWSTSPMLLYGNEGDDTLVGGAGDDFLIGGVSRDVLDGGDGADRYFLENEGAGDLIVDRGEMKEDGSRRYSGEPFVFPAIATESDIVIFPEGVTISDLRFSWTDEPIALPEQWYQRLGVSSYPEKAQVMAAVLTISWGGGHNARIYMPNAEQAPSGIEEFRFADGSSLTREQLLALAPAHDLDPREKDNDFSGDGYLAGFGGNDTITGGAGSDKIDGGDGDDLLIGGDGDDRITGGRGADTLIGGDGNDTLGAGLMDFWGEGNEYRGGGGSDLLLGTAGSDTYYFDLGDGGDAIQDFFHADDYYGGGSPYLDFSYGGALYYEAVGMPEDMLSLYDGYLDLQEAAQSWSYHGKDTIRFGAGIRPEDIEVSLEENGDWILRHVNGEDSIRVNAGYLGKESPIERIEFADSTVWRKSALGDFTTETVTGTAASETLRGTEGIDEFWSGAGDDVMIGQEGYDIYHYAAGDGQDVIVENLRAAVSPNGSHGACGGEVRFDGELEPGSLDVSRNGDDLVFGIAGMHDTLTIQSWFAEPGRIDRFVFSDGTIWDAATIEQRLPANHAPEAATPLSGQSATKDTPFSFTVPENAFVDVDPGDTLTYTVALDNGDPLPAWLSFDIQTRTFTGTPANGDLGDLQLRVIATDQAGASASQSFSLIVTGPTDTGEILNGTAGNDILTGGPGDDLLDGGLGSDTLIGGAGDDTYIVDNTGDVVTELAGEGSDLVLSSISHTLSANVENLTLSGEAAIDGTGNALNNTLIGNATNNVLNGEAGEDLLDGGVGNDTLRGGLGNDTYRFGRGDGQDTIAFDEENSADKWNILEFKADIAPGDVSVRRSGETLILTLAGSENRVTVNSFFVGGMPGTGATNPIQEVHFADGTVWDLATLVAKALAGTDSADSISGTTDGDLLDGEGGNDTFYGGSGNDTLLGGDGNDGLYGEAGNDTLFGGSGSDIFYGGSGDDALDGGLGNDILSGGLGNDTYRFGEGDSWDVIYTDPDDSAGKWNVLEFKENVHPDEVVVVRSGVNLWLKLAGSTEGVALQGFFSGNAPGTGIDNPVQEVKFADGTNWDMATLVVKAMTGTDGADNISGTTGTNILQGGAGNDTLTDASGSALFHGGTGNDTMVGGAGAEIFVGGQGNDTYGTGEGNDIILFNKGDGQDIFASGGTGSDTLSLGGSGLNYDDLAFAKSSSDLILKIGATDQITFKDWYASTPSNPVARLQVMAEAMDGFTPGGSDPLKDQKVENFDFAGLVGAFDTACAADSGLTSWALSHALLDFQLGGSDTAAIGGDLAYLYGKNGSLAGIGVTPALGTLSDAGLGSNPQELSSLSSLQTGTLRLS